MSIVRLRFFGNLHVVRYVVCVFAFALKTKCVLRIEVLVLEVFATLHQAPDVFRLF